MDVHVRERDGVIILKPVGDVIVPASGELRSVVDRLLADPANYLT